MRHGIHYVSIVTQKVLLKGKKQILIFIGICLYRFLLFQRPTGPDLKGVCWRSGSPTKTMVPDDCNRTKETKVDVNEFQVNLIDLK